MATYLVETDNGTYEVETDDPTPVAPRELSADSLSEESIAAATKTALSSRGDYESRMGELKGTAKAALDLFTAPADLAYRGGNYLANKVTGNEVDPKGYYPSDWVNQFLDFASGGAGDKKVEDLTRTVGNVATAFMVPSQASKIASNIPVLAKLAKGSGALATTAGLAAKGIGYGTEGAAYGMLGNAKSDDLLGSAETGAALNIAIPTALATVGKGASALAKKFPGLANTLERKSLGARATDYGKASGTRTVETPDGQIETFVKSKLDDLVSSGKLGSSRDPAKLAKVIDNETSVLNDAINSKISEYDNAIELGLAPAVAPEFNATRKFLSKGKAPANEVNSYLGEVSDLEKAINEQGEGFLGYIQEQKKAFSNKWKSAAETKDPKAGFYRAVYDDLKTTVEKYAPEVKDLNKELQKYMILNPIVNRALRAQESASPIDQALKLGFTTGGIMGPVVGGGAVGGPVGALAGAAMGLTGKALSTPTGQSLAARALQKSIAPTELFSSLFSGAVPLGKAAALEMSGQSEKPSTPSTGTRMGKKEDVEAKILANPTDAAIYEMESASGKKLKNPTSSAKGAFQLIDSTAKKLGVKNVMDLEDNYNGYLKLKQENINRFGTEDPELIYSAHYLGAPLLEKVLQKKPLSSREQVIVDGWERLVMPRFRRVYSKILEKQKTLSV